MAAGRTRDGGYASRSAAAVVIPRDILLDIGTARDYHVHSLGCGQAARLNRERIMAWTRPTLREICIGMEINAYMAGEL